MSNHFHVLLEVPPAPEAGISDGLLLKRLAALYSEAFVGGVAQELDSARKEMEGRFADLSAGDGDGAGEETGQDARL